jgi:putative spermidine/putrescine transport system substrate-binding protein
MTQPDSVDIADVEGWQSKLATKRGILQGIEVKKIKEFDNILPIFTKGELEGHKIPRQGISPYEAMYVEKPNATELHEGVTDWMTFLPQVYNADSIGYRPDLVGHEVTEWKELIDPKFKGKAAILDVPAIGIMDAALCFESAGLITYGNKGNMTKKERPFPRHLDHVRPIGAAHGRRRSHHSVDVVAGGRRGPRQGHSLHLRPGQR